MRATAETMTDPLPSVLIVENEQVVRRALCRILDGHAACRDVVSPAEAIAAMEDAPAQLVITDVSLGTNHPNGCQVARTILQRWPGTRFLFLSGYPMLDLWRKHHCPYGLPLLQKPFGVRDLRDAMAERLAAPPWYPTEWRETDGPTI